MLVIVGEGGCASTNHRHHGMAVLSGARIVRNRCVRVPPHTHTHAHTHTHTFRVVEGLTAGVSPKFAPD